MKKLILLIIILTISFACKKQSVEPTPDPEPVKTNKAFKATITFTTDSLVGYQYQSGWFGSQYKNHQVIISLDTVSYSPSYGLQNAVHPFGGSNSTELSTFNTSITTNDLNKVFTYYINITEQLVRNGNHVTYRYSKIYTFHEGDNGIINFNTLS